MKFILSDNYKVTKLCILFFGIFFSCNKPPEYDKAPKISFNRITVDTIYSAVQLGQFDSINITLNFMDGDGNLGVSQQDASNPKYKAFSDTITTYDSILKQNVTSYDFQNYRAEMFLKKDGKWVSLPFGKNFKGKFPALISYDELGPIEGTLNYNIQLPYCGSIKSGGLKNNDTIRFEVKIIDRSLNVSNTITTDSLVILSPRKSNCP